MEESKKNEVKENIGKLKIEVYDLREKLQIISEQGQYLQKAINDKVLQTRALEAKQGNKN